MVKEKQIDIELMRILAAFFVIFNHTGRNGFFLFSAYENHDIWYWIYLFISVFCKFSVPLFFMISGALMLDKETESYLNLWGRKILKILALLFIWSIPHYLIFVYNGDAEFDFITFITRFAVTNWNSSLWYLYAYIPFLMSVPLLQRIAKALSNKEYLYLISLAVGFLSLLPVGQYLIWRGHYEFNNYFRLEWVCSNILLYPLIGFFFRHRISDLLDKKKIILLWILNIIAIFVSCYLTNHRASLTGELSEAKSQMFHNTFVLVNCTSIFVTCQYFVRHVHIAPWIQRVIVSLGGCTFGVYLLHMFIHRFFGEIGLIKWIYNIFKVTPMLSIWLYCACVFAVGYLFTLLLKRIPVVRKIIS